MSKMRFKVKYKMTCDRNIHRGIDGLDSWYLVDQQGIMYTSGPMQPLKIVGNEYVECEPMIQIGSEWLTVDEIKKKLNAPGCMIPEGDREKIMSPLDVKFKLDYINTWLTMIIENGKLYSAWKNSLLNARARINNVRIDMNEGNSSEG